MQGRFHEIDGGFVFDEENIGQSSVELTINTTSVDMDVEALNEHLRTADFFNVEQFPTMTFKSTSTKKTGDNTGEITGDFTLLGVTHPVTLNVVFNRAAEHPSTKKYTAGFSATGSLKRSDFGMTTGVPFLGDQIEISIQVEGQRVE